MSEKLIIKALGGLSIQMGDEPHLRFGSRRAEVLITYLALNRQQHEREVLATLLWDDRTSEQAFANLRSLLSRLPKPIKAVLQSSRQSVGLEETLEVWLDAAVFDQQCVAAQANWPADGFVSVMEEALKLYQGDFLKGVFVSDSRGLEEWMALIRERLLHQAIEARMQLARHDLHRRDYAAGIAHTRALLALDPLRESGHRLLMRLLARNGDLTSALAQYEICGRILEEELGVEPAGETTALYERIKMARIPAPFVMPTQPTPFVGREKELTQINRRLDQTDCRLLTIVGPGGTGKTRLAAQAAGARRGDYLHGIYFVSLAAVNTAVHLPTTIAVTLQIPILGDASPTEQLFAYLRQKEMLLILDNMEHLLAEGADFVLMLLEAAPNMQVIVTSRERLQLRSEYLLAIHGLSYPQGEVEDALAYDAVQLFATLGRRVMADFDMVAKTKTAVTQICQLVEGMPLGIELAAASMPHHSAPDIARRIQKNMDFLATQLRDMPARHRSLRAVFDHSWQLLSPVERQVFRQLSVFPGRFTLASAEPVAQATMAVLDSLVVKSLIRLTDGRYQMHEMLRHYAAEQLSLVSEEETAVLNQYTHYYATFMHRHMMDLQGQRVQGALDDVGEEIENIRAGWRWAVERRQSETIDQMMPGLALFYKIRSWFQEGERDFRLGRQQLCPETSDSDQDSLLCARLLLYQAEFAYYLGHYEQATLQFNHCQTLFSSLGQPVELSRTYWGLSVIALYTGRFAAAAEQGRQALDISREANDDIGQARALKQLGGIAQGEGNYEKARKYYQEALQLDEVSQSEWYIAASLSNLGTISGILGDYDEAKVYFQRSLVMYEAMGDRHGQAKALQNMSVIAYIREEYENAMELRLQVLDICYEIGYQWGIGSTLRHLGDVARKLMEINEAKGYYQRSLRVWEALGDLRGQALSYLSLGMTAVQQEQYQAAQTYFSQSVRLSMEVGAQPVTLAALNGVAHTLAENGQLATAVTIFAFTLKHPAIESQLEAQTKPMLEKLMAQLPEHIIAKARSQGERLANNTDGLATLVSEVVG